MKKYLRDIYNRVINHPLSTLISIILIIITIMMVKKMITVDEFIAVMTMLSIYFLFKKDS